ncbi:MAG: methyltransferase domain-containing protein [Luteimonas sp.]
MAIEHESLEKRLDSPAVDPRDYQPPLELPGNLSLYAIREAMVSQSIDNSPAGELRNYAYADCERFIRTLDLIPAGAGELLEIGSNPYFTTMLIKQFRPEYTLSMINYFGSGLGDLVRQRVEFDGFDGVRQSVVLESPHVNVETDSVPFADERFDLVLFCEVLEHMTNDPLAPLKELSRVTKMGGHIILTTPNATRLENVIAFCEGRNIYDPYSGYGPYGRHNREYTRHELHLLMDHCGFVAEISYTANVGPDRPMEKMTADVVRSIIAATPNREYDLGQYLFTRWRKEREPHPKRPDWLYRSYPAEQLV